MVDTTFETGGMIVKVSYGNYGNDMGLSKWFTGRYEYD